MELGVLEQEGADAHMRDKNQAKYLFIKQQWLSDVAL